VLIVLSIFSGYIFKDYFTGLGSNFFGNSLADINNLQEAEFLPTYIKLIPLVGAIGTLALAYVLSTHSKM